MLTHMAGAAQLQHARYYWLLLAEGHLNRRLFGDNLGAACAGRVALTGLGSTVFGSQKVWQGAVSAAAPFRPRNQRL